MQLKNLESGIEVNGRTMYSMVDGFGLVKNLVSKHLQNAGLPIVIDKGA